MKRMCYILSGKGAKGIIREKDEKWCLKRKKGQETKQVQSKKLDRTDIFLPFLMRITLTTGKNKD